jgi:hypothetical protein
MWTRTLAAVLTLALPWTALTWCGMSGEVAPKGDDTGWGKAVDGLVCRVTLQSRFVVGQPMPAVFEIKNITDKKRFIFRYFTPLTEYLSIVLDGPTGKLNRGGGARFGELSERSFQIIAPGEVKRLEVSDLRMYFPEFNPLSRGGRKEIPTGPFQFKWRFRSPPVPARFAVTNGQKAITYTDASAELLAGQWADEVESTAAFELAPLGKDDLIVHEWGVFTVLNDAKYANANRKEEWGGLPLFFYRQFPKERLNWVPSAWDKPLIYFYAKPAAMQLRVKVTFKEGAPVVWWPAAADPVDNWPGPQIVEVGRPFRSLTWEIALGDTASKSGKQVKVEEFPLPPECWLQQARLASASKVTVSGADPDKARTGRGLSGRPETERFLYYDGLVPAPDYLHCEKVEDTFIALRNLAKFEIARLFVVDRRAKERVGFVAQAGLASGPNKIGFTTIPAGDWPAAGKKQVRKALLDAGLFEAEADSLLAIWHQRLFEADGITAFHILPAGEYDRMLPLDIQPAPAARPVRVGIALHPHLEVEPALAQRVAGLIRDLDDPKYQKRQSASKELLEIGPVAIGTLRAELQKKPSLEMKRRIESILDRVDAMEWLKPPEIGKKAQK